MRSTELRELKLLQQMKLRKSIYGKCALSKIHASVTFYIFTVVH